MKPKAFQSLILCFIAAAGVMAAATAFVYRAGATLYYGDAEAHLDIARRIVDSRTPGWSQVGTTWLPLPHLLMIPLVRNDWLWQTGLAGAITSGMCMAIAATFLFAVVQRLFGSATAASAGAAVFLLNPNTLYLGSIPMTESVFLAALCGVLYFTVRFRETQGWGALLGASVAALAGTLTRYEAWFLLPFVAIYIWANAREKRWAATIGFCLIAGAGPALWLAHNRWYFGDPLYFYRGPYSALAIQGKSPYPGRGDWRVAAQYFFAAGQLIAGWPALRHRRSRNPGRFGKPGDLAFVPARAAACILRMGYSFVRRSAICSDALAAHLVQHSLRSRVPSPDRDRRGRAGPIRETRCHRNRDSRAGAVPDSFQDAPDYVG